jgi:hypothetical protein
LNKISLAVLTMVLFISLSAFAGTANDDIRCDGQGVSLSGSVPGEEHALSLNITQGGKSVQLVLALNQSTLKEEGNAEPTAVEDMANGVYTLQVSRTAGGYGVVQLYALPQTVVYKKNQNGYSATFSGKLMFNLSELNTETQFKIVKCTMTFQI